MNAFYHEVNYAFRKLWGNAPATASILAPSTKQVQTMLIQAAPNILREPASHWPDWCNKVHEQQCHCVQGSSPHRTESISHTDRTLKQQETDDATCPCKAKTLAATRIRVSVLHVAGSTAGSHAAEEEQQPGFMLRRPYQLEIPCVRSKGFVLLDNDSLKDRCRTAS